jgi:mRNA interferase MazF
VKRGELFRVYKGTKHDTKNYRVFLVVSRQDFIDTSYSTVICAPVYTTFHDISTQVEVGVDEGLKHDSAIHCDELISLPRHALTDYIGCLSDAKIKEVNDAIRVALAV